MTIKVLHYLRHLSLGGTEKTCQLFFEHATRGEFEVAVAFEEGGDHTRLQEFVKGAKVCGGSLHRINSYSEKEPNGQALQHVIDGFRPDIFHVYRSGYPEFPGPGLHISIPHFIETNVFGHYDANMFIDRSLFMSEWLMQNTLRHLAPISRGIMPRRFDFVNNPVEQPYTSDRLPIRESWGDKVIVLGRVGRPDNGIYNAISIEAARMLREQNYDIRFIVVAPPGNMIDDLARYEIPFYVVEPTVNPLVLSQAYNSMDIYAHARADGETFGVNIAEAMIHGLPVVTHIATPSVPGMGVFQAQATLVEHGKTGFVVRNNAVDYVQMLKVLIENQPLRQSMGDAGREKAMREFEVSVCVNKLENIYKQVVNE